MPRKQPENKNKILVLTVVGVLVLSFVAVGLVMKSKRHSQVNSQKATSSQPTEQPIKNSPIIEYRDGKESAAVRKLTEKRKADLGVDNTIDLVLKKNESLKIGNTVVSMKDILDHIKLKRGGIVEDDLKEKALKKIESGKAGKAADFYGIHVVKPGDNIWNIHFRFLKDYFAKRGITLSPVADEPNAQGYSSGVGKILKFSENMVYIYNIREKRLDVNLNLIQPLSKIVVFDMGRVFALLDQIDYKDVSRIQFDGETLWIPAKQ